MLGDRLSTGIRTLIVLGRDSFALSWLPKL
jgi:hypothetical protein